MTCTWSPGPARSVVTVPFASTGTPVPSGNLSVMASGEPVIALVAVACSGTGTAAGAWDVGPVPPGSLLVATRTVATTAAATTSTSGMITAARRYQGLLGGPGPGLGRG